MAQEAASSQCDLHLDHRRGYRFAKISGGEGSRSAVLDALSQIAAELGRTYNRRVMIVRDIPSVYYPGDGPLPFEQFLKFSKGLRIATVNEHTAIDDELRSIITSAPAGANVTGYFNNEAEAEQWLLAEDPPELF